MRPSSLACLCASIILAAGLAIPSVAVAAPRKAPERPCGNYTLWATHAATAGSFDRNGDRFECYPGAHPDPYVPPGKDNRPLPRDPAGYKFYSWGNGTTGITIVDATLNTFTAYVYGQEDDPDMNGCRILCTEELSYDANDLFYVDYKNGSRLVSISEFEAVLPGADRFSMIYAVDVNAVNVFSIDLAH